ncbi:exported protein of unknown function [Blastococcus saxobsidens DD2]|uniref:Uncharacterized protein n=1 Tax=Blastococcus saxobsidens (strain DD2) TaxID=1146883 RepID=H6RRX5_BLASD|nr:exported protein of unknown function [Blastococcus saxobsidens DD2]
MWGRKLTRRAGVQTDPYWVTANEASHLSLKAASGTPGLGAVTGTIAGVSDS